MNNVQEIVLAFQRLPGTDRRNLLAWLSGDAAVEYGVAEAAPEYPVGPESQFLTVEEYLKLEEVSEIRHEYVAGQVFAMVGETKRHNAITLNVAAALRTHLRGGPCRSYVEGIKVGLTFDREDFYYYPDVVVSCGPQDLEPHFVRDPKLIIEVLSPSTQATDRREKALNYRKTGTLEEYVLIAQHKPEVIIYRREARWAPQTLVQLDAIAEFPSVALGVPLTSIYEDALDI